MRPWREKTPYGGKRKLRPAYHAIATTRKVETREKESRLDRIIGAACRADKTIHESVKAALRGVKSPADREFLKTEGWL